MTDAPARYHKRPVHYRRLGRQWAMQFLFQIDFAGLDDAVKPDVDLFWEQLRRTDDCPSGRDFTRAQKTACEIIAGVQADLAEIDAVITQRSEKWSMERMSLVDKNILRVAVYEMLRSEKVPPVVAIDEAIEISKLFGGDNSGSFINGILHTIKDCLDRPSRIAMKPE